MSSCDERVNPPRSGELISVAAEDAESHTRESERIQIQNNECYGTTRCEESAAVVTENIVYDHISGEVEHIQVENNECYGTRHEKSAINKNVDNAEVTHIQIEDNECYEVVQWKEVNASAR